MPENALLSSRFLINQVGFFLQNRLNLSVTNLAELITDAAL